MKHYDIYVNGVIVKSYFHDTQVMAWCYINNFVNKSYTRHFLDPRVEIKVVENDS